jgi:hypothetical protein
VKGHIRRRGERSRELKFDAGRDPFTGRRLTRYASFKGTKREAQVKLAGLITAVDDGSYVEPSKITIGDFVCGRIDLGSRTGRHLREHSAALSAAR